MNWRNSLGLLLLVSSLTWASADVKHYQTYQRLDRQLQQNPLTTLPAIELFVQQVTSADNQAQQMASYLHLQVCMTLNRYACAVQAADHLLALNHADGRKPELLKLSAQLHYQTQDYQMVSSRVNQWLAIAATLQQTPVANQWAELYALKAYSYYHQQLDMLAITAMEQAISYQINQQRQLFVLGLYQQQRDWHNVNRVLHSLVSQYADNAEYWERYAYSFLKLEQESLAIHVLGSAYKAGRLPCRSIVLYAQMLLRFNAPQRAAKVLEENPSLGELPIYNALLTQSYLLSRDKQKASEWLARRDNKESDITRGLLAYQQGQWQQAIALFKPLDMSDKRNHYWLLLTAISEFELQRWNAARTTFQRLAGTRYDETSTQWLSQIDYLTKD